MLDRGQFDRLKEEVIDFFPSRITDAHVHTGIRAEIIGEREKGLFLPYSWLHNKRVISADPSLFKEIYPSKLDLIGIPLPFDVMDPNVYNDKLVHDEKIECEMWGLKDVEAMEDSIAKFPFCGIKFHPRMVKKERVLITDMVSEKAMEFIDKHKLPVTLEIKNGFIKEDLETLKKMNDSYDFKIILPHMAFNHKGFTLSWNDYQKSLKGDGEFEKEFNKINNLDNIFLDTSMIIDKRIIKGALSSLGPDKLLFGTDFPFGFTPKIQENRPLAKVYAPDLGKIVFGQPDHTSWRFYYNIYLQIKALKDAEGNLDIREKIFRKNAKEVFKL
ncbi:MAG: amidohydrolase family protein [Candidatus Woesearchaeota archaeon]